MINYSLLRQSLGEISLCSGFYPQREEVEELEALADAYEAGTLPDSASGGISLNFHSQTDGVEAMVRLYSDGRTVIHVKSASGSLAEVIIIHRELSKAICFATLVETLLVK
jgi:hypothetical protein